MTTLAHCNNRSATLIGTGRCTEAYFELRRAMAELAQHIRLDDSFKSLPGNTTPFKVSALALLVSETVECVFSSPLIIEDVEVEDDTVEAVSCVCSVVLFNMALASQRLSARKDLPIQQQRRGLDQARSLYKQSYEIARNLHIPLLHLALCNNLLEISYEYGDLEDMNFWKSEFNAHLIHQEMGTPDDILVHLLKVQLFFTPAFQTARAA
uniref:Uncharacterized protein n=1 Tax=Amphora coffeiformis TaxID=265554 RepID=A0A7S3P7Y2_9STRA|eukprot:scaffold6072_cov94-Amphora_coffeaeformis.AAC.1